MKIASPCTGRNDWLGRVVLPAFAGLLALALPASAAWLFDPPSALGASGPLEAAGSTLLPFFLAWGGVLGLAAILRSLVLFWQERRSIGQERTGRINLDTLYWRQWQEGVLGGPGAGNPSLEAAFKEIVRLENLATVHFSQGLVLGSGGVLLLWWVEPILALTTVAISGCCVGCWMVLVRPHHRDRAGRVTSQERAEELVRAVATLRSLRCEEAAFIDWQKRTQEEEEHGRGDWLRWRLDRLMPATVGSLVILAVFFLAEPLGADTVASIFAFAASVGVFIAGIDLLTDSFRFLQEVKRWRQRLHLPRPRANRSAAVAVSGEASPVKIEPTGAWELRNVSFGHDREAPPLLDHLSWAMPAGQQGILTGPSGSGKSTLLRLLLGLEQPWSGEILFDGVPLGLLDLPHLRRHIGFVGQNTPLVPGSLLSNLDPEGLAERPHLLRALEQADLAREITRLPLGLASVVTGDNFSAGFRQRLALARALLRAPRILLLDEATSSVDRTCQARLLHHLRKLPCTVLLISQRVSSFSEAEAIWILEQGKVRPSLLVSEFSADR